METITYCERWNNKLMRPIEPLTAGEAQRRDQAKELYTVVVGDPAAPRCYVEIAWENNHVGVWFLDEVLRRSAHLSFTGWTTPLCSWMASSFGTVPAERALL